MAFARPGWAFTAKVKELNLFPEMSDQEQTNEIWKWLMYELLGFDRRLSLEGLGLLGLYL